MAFHQIQKYKEIKIRAKKATYLNFGFFSQLSISQLFISTQVKKS